MSDAQQQPPAPLPTGAAETDEESAAKEEDACVAEPATAAAPPPRRPQRAASAAAAVPVTHSPAPLRATRRITHALTATALGESSVVDWRLRSPASDSSSLGLLGLQRAHPSSRRASLHNSNGGATRSWNAAAAAAAVAWRSPSQRSSLLSPCSTPDAASTATTEPLRCGVCDGEIDEPIIGPWTCACGFTNVASANICMNDGFDRKTAAQRFCSPACEQLQQQQHLLTPDARTPSVAPLWIERFTLPQMCTSSYSSSFDSSVWFTADNAPCVSCPECGSAVRLSKNIMRGIHARIAEERPSSLSRRSSGSAVSSAVPGQSSVKETEPAQPPPAPLERARDLFPDESKQRPAAEVSETKELSSLDDDVKHVHLKMEQQQGLRAEPASSDSMALAQAASIVLPPEPSWSPLEESASAPIASQNSAARAVHEIVSAPAGCRARDEMAMPSWLVIRDHSSLARARASPAHLSPAHGRLHHPLRIDTNLPPQVLCIMPPSPSSPTTRSERIAAAAAAAALQRRKLQAELLPESVGGSSEELELVDWQGELRCEQCKAQFRFTDLR